MKKVCEHCGAIIERMEYDLTITTPGHFENYQTCSEECMKNILHKKGIATYPEINKSSLKRSKIAIVISIVAIVIQIIRIIMAIL